MKLSIVIPCLNEAQTIRQVVLIADRAGKKYFPRQYEVLVADNGSTDGTLEKLRKQGIAKIIHVPIRGYGAALHWGILKARGQYVLFADADLSYDFHQLKRFAPYVGNADVVLGSRFRGEIQPDAMPWLHRYLGTPVLTFCINLLYHLNTSDSNSGMRMIKKAFYKQLKMHNSGMEWASELLIKTALSGGRYVEVPITLRKDKRGRKPHLLSWIDGWRHLKAIVLLRPNSLFGVAFLLLFFAILARDNFFSLSFFFCLLAFGLGLSILAAKLIQMAIDQKESRSVDILSRFPLVPFACVLNLAVILSMFFFHQRFQIVNLIFAGAVGMIDVWVFHIETIRTHLMKRLPTSLR